MRRPGRKPGRKVAVPVLVAAICLVGCDTGGDGASPSPAPSVEPTTSSASPSQGTVGLDPLVTWSPPPVQVGERSEGWLRETLLVTAPGDVRLHVTPRSTSMTLDYVDGARSLAIWIEIENAGDADWEGTFGSEATLSDELGNTFLPVGTPTPADLHPDPGRYGQSNRNLMEPVTVAAGETGRGVLVFRPTLGNRPATLAVTLDGERTTSWVVNIGQL